MSDHDRGEPGDGRRRETAADPVALDLAELRARIDILDREIVRLLNERAQLGLAAGRVKAASGRPMPDPDREREVLVRVAMGNEGPLPQGELIELYRTLMAAIRRLEERHTTASRPK